MNKISLSLTPEEYETLIKAVDYKYWILFHGCGPRRPVTQQYKKVLDKLREYKRNKIEIKDKKE